MEVLSHHISMEKTSGFWRQLMRYPPVGKRAKTRLRTRPPTTDTLDILPSRAEPLSKLFPSTLTDDQFTYGIRRDRLLSVLAMRELSSF